jgi:hypothetical protein
MVHSIADKFIGMVDVPLSSLINDADPVNNTLGQKRVYALQPRSDGRAPSNATAMGDLEMSIEIQQSSLTNLVPSPANPTA